MASAKAYHERCGPRALSAKPWGAEIRAFIRCSAPLECVEFPFAGIYMLKTSQFWLLTAIAILAAIFAITNMVLFQGNRLAQTEVGARQQFIQQSVQLEVLYREMAKALADLAVRNRDADLSALLSSHGISVSVNPAPGSPAKGSP